MIAATSNGLEMSPELAKKLFHEGAILLVLNIPSSTEFGIDMKSWTTGHKFKGIKMIPPGYHYVYYNAVNSHGDVAPRIGFFHKFQPQEVVVKIWNSDKEELEDKVVTDEELQRIKNDQQNLDSYLGAYPYDVLELWTKLTTHISDHVVSKLSPDSGIIRSALEMVAESSPASSTDENQYLKRKLRRKWKWGRPQNEEEKEESLLPQMVPTPGTQINYSQPKEIYPPNSTPSEITQHFMDKTYAFEQIIQLYPTPQDVLGEFQFSFLCFILGLNYESFLQWKNLLELFCSCEVALEKYIDLYVDFIRCLQVHLCECSDIEDNFLMCDNAEDNLIYKHVTYLFKTIYTSSVVNDDLVNSIAMLQDHLRRVFNWSFQYEQEEDDEDLPVIVDD
ncbi:hypothetical protein M8J76_012408 [Diaphorina citri]|nr:hypothetical protein M8J75_008212 [Diaphorina citri]KAI5723894.1 hypothetical protein M8J76_012408 [Diaphorina citri]